MDIQPAGTYTSYFLLLVNSFIKDAKKGCIDIEEVKEFLDSDDFRPFSERLLVFINRQTGLTMTAVEAYKNLYNAFKENGISISRNTVKSWLNTNNELDGGGAPQYGDDDRDRVYKIAFALGLDVQETTELFNKVFLDNAFNLRNPREFVYLYCINSGKSYMIAQQLIEAADVSGSEFHDQTVITSRIGEYAISSNDDQDIVEFIIQHPDNFSRGRRTAKNELDWLRSELQGDEGTPGLAQKEYDEFEKWQYEDPHSPYGGNNKHSLDFVLKMLNGGGAGIKEAVLPTIKNVFLRKEITTNFPDSESFANPKPSSYILRKELILLYFYWYWVKVRLYQQGGSFHGFIAETNSMLADCGFQPLYAGNPYDCLFMFCAACYSGNAENNPLVVYRELLCCAIEEEE